MLLRVLATIAGLAVIAAATDANIRNAGGYGSSDTFLIVTVAVLLSIGMAYATIELRDGLREGPKLRMAGAASLVVCLLAGEAYWLLLNVDRELQRRSHSSGRRRPGTRRGSK
jgi:hypothetical protein